MEPARPFKWSPSVPLKNDACATLGNLPIASFSRKFAREYYSLLFSQVNHMHQEENRTRCFGACESALNTPHFMILLSLLLIIHRVWICIQNSFVLPLNRCSFRPVRPVPRQPIDLWRNLFCRSNEASRPERKL